jgi:prepilin-type N-terminal cleavage/methylation domain-containing protein
MQKKKGFTVLELVIVIVIIGILMLAFKGSFQIKNRDNLYAEACINNLYGEISNYLYTAITSKAISSGTLSVYPEVYSLFFDTSNINTIFFKYTSQGIIYTGKTLSLTGNVPVSFNCRTNQFTMALSGKTQEVQINK